MTPGSDLRFPGARRGSISALVCILLAGQGCYAYHVTELPRLTRGEQVRVELSDGGRGTLPAGGSIFRNRTIEGRFGRLESDSVIVSIWIGEAYAGTPFQATYRDLVLPRDLVTRVENRQLSKGRTALAAAGTVAVIALLIDGLAWNRFFSSGGGQGPPNPPSPFIMR